jgi:hypothetical protein
MTRDVDDRTRSVAALLREVGETHHVVYRIADGEDPDWASWYAAWLIEHSELPQILRRVPVNSELVWLLVGLDKQYSAGEQTTSWPEWYAERIVERLGAGPGSPSST